MQERNRERNANRILKPNEIEESDVSGHHLQAKTIITGYYLPGDGDVSDEGKK